MSWFNSSKGLASLAKTALKEAQKQIDKALDIQDDAANVESLIPADEGSSKNSSADDLSRINKELNTSTKEDKIKILPSMVSASAGSEHGVTSSWGSFTGSFFENPNANEMVTTAPKAKLSISSDMLTAPARSNTTKRQSVTSNSDSVELLSPPLTTPSSELTSPESIVIIASSEAGDDKEDDSISLHTVVDENTSDTRHIDLLDNSSHSSTKLLVSMEEISNDAQAAVDSDSTQSFEEIVMHAAGDDHNLDVKLMSAQGSNDEIETTTTSSDIEIISNPNNGDSSSTNSTSRTSPMKNKKAACGSHATITNPCKKGHNREPSEISILSEDSQSDLDKALHRISELNEMLETREHRLLETQRQMATTQQRNNELQAILDAMKSSSTDLDMGEEYTYTQRLSALEKKFQMSIRERDSLRILIQSLKQELQSKIARDELTESQAMIEELRLEGEKLSKEILQQSNIIKKLRAKEKSSDAFLKKNKEQIESLTDEIDRLKKTLNAKEEVERSQIEAVHKMSSEKRKLAEDNAQYLSQIEDLHSKCASLQANFDVAKSELQEQTRLHSDLTRTCKEAMSAKKEQEVTKAENQEMLTQLNELREKLRHSEMVIVKREQQLRVENRELMRRLETAEMRAETFTHEASLTTIPLMRQLESLQEVLSQRSNKWNNDEKILLAKLDAAQMRLKSLEDIEAKFKDKTDLLQSRCVNLEEKLSVALMEEEKLRIQLSQAESEFNSKEAQLNRQILKITDEFNECKARLIMLEEVNKNQEERLRKKVEQPKGDVTDNGDDGRREDFVMPVLSDLHHRANSPALSAERNSLEETIGSIDWQPEDLDCISNSGRHTTPLTYGMHMNFVGPSAATTTTLEHLQSMLKQRDGELVHLQWEVSRLHADRDVLNDEISSLTLELETVKDKVHAHEALERSFQELQHRYDALLQMYGEKVERTEELELDLVELKEAYKTQIDELLAQPQQIT